MRLALILSIFLLLGCKQEKKSNSKYSDLYNELNKHNSKNGIFEGTPTYDSIVNNPNIKIEYFDSPICSKILEQDIEMDFKFDSSTYEFSNNKLIIHNFSEKSCFGEVVTYRISDNQIHLNTFAVEQVDLDLFKNKKTIAVSDCQTMEYTERKITLKIKNSDRNKTIFLNDKKIRNQL